MATHDYVIANGTGAAVRADINNALAAIVSNNSNGTDPSTTYAYQFYADTGDGKLYIRNAANNGWIEVGTLASANLGLVDAAAPTLTGDVTCSSTGFLKIPVGTTAQRPGSPALAQFRWNSTLSKAEIYDGSDFVEVGGGGGGATGGDSGANAVFWENQATVTHDYTLTAARGVGSFSGVNGITINSGITVTIPADSVWTIV